MTGFVERVEALSVSTVSPDGLVRARMATRADLSLELLPEVERRHDGTSLVRMISATASAVMRKYGAALREARPPGRDPVPDSVAAERRRLFGLKLADVTAVGVSPRNLVKVEIVGGADWRFAIRPNVLGRVDLDLLSGELNAAVALARADYGRQLAEVRREVSRKIECGAR